jgi:hypothetical protein
MRRTVLWECAALLMLVAGCATRPPPEPASLPPSVFGVYLDNDTGAIDYAAWAFASAHNLRNNPSAAARALIALEYLPDELRSNPRWVGTDAALALHLDHARQRYRQVLAIRPDASSQMVVDALLAVATSIQSRNQPAAGQALRSPVFTLPPAGTLATLSNLPYDEEANLATLRLSDQASGSGGTRS